MMNEDIETVLITEEQIKAKARELGKKISEDYKGKNLMLLCILKGAMMFLADLSREIDLPLSIDFMAVSSYGLSTTSSGVVRIIKDLDYSIEGKDILIVEDVVDSGLTLSYLRRVLIDRHPASLSICSLLDKPLKRRVEVPIDYTGFKIDDLFVVGYGLDFAEKYRNLPYIGILKPEIYKF